MAKKDKPDDKLIPHPVVFRAAVHAANKCATGYEEPKPVQTAESMALQSVAQSMAIEVQDATDLVRNIGAVETAAIGTATSKWIQDPQNTLYQQIIDHSVSVLHSTAEIFKDLGFTAGDVLKNFPRPIDDTIFNQDMTKPDNPE